MPQELQWCQGQLMIQHNQIYQQHQDNRYDSRLQKRIGIPACFIRRQAVATIIQVCKETLKYRVSQHISNASGKQRYQNRHGHIMPHQFTLGITGCTQRTNNRSFFGNGIAGGNSKDKRQNHHNNIQEYDEHNPVAAHVISGKVNGLVVVCRQESFQLHWNLLRIGCRSRCDLAGKCC